MSDSLARSFVHSPEDECVLPLPARRLCVVLVVLDHDERQFPPFEVELDDLLPEEEADLLLPLVHQDAGRSQAKRVLGSVFSLRKEILDNLLKKDVG